MNIIVIITDSLRLDHVGCYGSHVKTPNIDKLASEGAKFLNAFSENLLDGTNVQSRARDDGSPQPIGQVGAGAHKEGYGASVGSGVGFVMRVFLVHSTATAGGSTVELQAKLMRSGAEAVGY